MENGNNNANNVVEVISEVIYANYSTSWLAHSSGTINVTPFSLLRWWLPPPQFPAVASASASNQVEAKEGMGGRERVVLLQVVLHALGCSPLWGLKLRVLWLGQEVGSGYLWAVPLLLLL